MTDSLAAECEQVLVVKDPASSAEAIVAVHSTHLGPAHGGIRRWPYESFEAAMADVCWAIMNTNEFVFQH